MNGQIWLRLKQIELETLNLWTNSSQDSILKREHLEQQPDQEKESHQIVFAFSKCPRQYPIALQFLRDHYLLSCEDWSLYYWQFLLDVNVSAVFIVLLC